ncbi:MAG: hypothetical protein ACE37D_19690 [Pseudomonadales bacterium]
MASLSQVLRWEIALQARSFIYPATVVSTLMICGFLSVLPVEQLSPAWVTFFVFIDPAMIGLSFVGAIILMEKSEGTILAVGVSPMEPGLYIAAKVISLTLVTFASGLAVAYVAADDFLLIRMLLTLTLSSTVAVLVGFACAARAPSMNKLTITLLWVSMIAYAPLLTHFGVLPESLTPLIALIPSYAVLLLLESCVSTSPFDSTLLIASFGYLVAWVVAGWLWASREYLANITTEGR